MKCVDDNEENSDMYLKVNSKYELIAVKDREEASDFMFEKVSYESDRFFIKHSSRYLADSDWRKQKFLDGPLKMTSEQKGVFYLEDASPKVCSLEEFKESNEHNTYRIKHNDLYIQFKKEAVSTDEGQQEQKLTSIMRVKNQDWIYFSFKLERPMQ